MCSKFFSDSQRFIKLDTSNWKTYTDAKFGFSFKYPSSWKFDSISEQNQSGSDPKTGKLWFNDTHGVNLSIPVDNGKPVLQVLVEIHTNNNNWGLDQFINEETYGNGVSYLGSTKNITIDGQSALEGVKPPSTRNVYTVSNLNTHSKSALYQFILYGNGGVVSGGACVGKDCNRPIPTPNLYKDSDPFLQQTIKEFNGLLATFKFIQ